MSAELARYLTRQEAAELARLHVVSLDRLCAQGRGPKRIKFGRPGSKSPVRFERDEVIRWLSAQQESA